MWKTGRRNPKGATRAIACLLVTIIALGCPDTPEQTLDLQSFDRAWATIRDHHYDPSLGGVDWGALRAELRPRVERATTRREVRQVIEEMIQRLGQSHFQLIPGEFLLKAHAEAEPSRFEGETGADVRLVEEEIVVTGVRQGSPAAAAGVERGWTVVRIDGETVSDWLNRGLVDLAQAPSRDGLLAAAAKEKMEGRPGDAIEVVFDTGMRQLTVSMTLEDKPGVRTTVGHVRGVRVNAEWRWLADRVGYIAFSSFIHPDYVMGRFNAAMEEFTDARGIVIDLRGNGGGMIPLAAGMSGWFMADKSARLGEVRMRETTLTVVVQPRLRVFAGKVAILVDGLTASCAEAFAAGMQDNGRARIFGQRTAGAVLASAIEMLPNGDALQYVFADYVSRNGRRLEGAGVIPDVEVPLTRAVVLGGEDVVLENALAWAR